MRKVFLTAILMAICLISQAKGMVPGSSQDTWYYGPLSEAEIKVLVGDMVDRVREGKVLLHTLLMERNPIGKLTPVAYASGRLIDGETASTLIRCFRGNNGRFTFSLGTGVESITVLNTVHEQVMVRINPLPGSHVSCTGGKTLKIGTGLYLTIHKKIFKKIKSQKTEDKLDRALTAETRKLVKEVQKKGRDLYVVFYFYDGREFRFVAAPVQFQKIFEFLQKQALTVTF